MHVNKLNMKPALLLSYSFMIIIHAIQVNMYTTKVPILTNDNNNANIISQVIPNKLKYEDSDDKIIKNNNETITINIDKTNEHSTVIKKGNKEEVKCAGDMLELFCDKTERIIINKIIFGKSKICQHNPWPRGCLRESYHFHPCTGLHSCKVKAPSYKIKGCGYNDYVQMEYQCLEAESVKDICVADTQKAILTSSSGFLASPGYPTMIIGGTHQTLICTARIVVTGSKQIKIFLLDSTVMKSFQTDPNVQCQMKLKFTELKQQQQQSVKSRSLCLEGMFFRNELIYTSLGNHLRIQLSVHNVLISNDIHMKGLLLHYKAFDSKHEDEVSTTKFNVKPSSETKLQSQGGIHTTVTATEDFNFIYYKSSTKKEDGVKTNETSNKTERYEINQEQLNTGIHLGSIIGSTLGSVMLILLLISILYYVWQRHRHKFIFYKDSSSVKVYNPPPAIEILGNSIANEQFSNKRVSTQVGYENHGFEGLKTDNSSSKLENNNMNKIKALTDECFYQNEEILLENVYSIPDLLPVVQNENMKQKELKSKKDIQFVLNNSQTTTVGKDNVKRVENKNYLPQHFSLDKVTKYEVNSDIDSHHKRINDWVNNQKQLNRLGSSNLATIKEEVTHDNVNISQMRHIVPDKPPGISTLGEGILLDDMRSEEETGDSRSLYLIRRPLLGPQVLPRNNEYSNSTSIDTRPFILTKRDKKLQGSYEDITDSNETQSLHYVSIQHLAESIDPVKMAQLLSTKAKNKVVYSSIDFEKSLELQPDHIADNSNMNDYEVPVNLKRNLDLIKEKTKTSHDTDIIKYRREGPSIKTLVTENETKVNNENTISYDKNVGIKDKINKFRFANHTRKQNTVQKPLITSETSDTDPESACHSDLSSQPDKSSPQDWTIQINLKMSSNNSNTNEKNKVPTQTNGKKKKKTAPLPPPTQEPDDDHQIPLNNFNNNGNLSTTVQSPKSMLKTTF